MSVRVMKRSGSLCVVAAMLAGLLALNPASAKVARTWLAGASAEKVTPLPFDAKRDLLEFPQTVCPRQVFGGPRAFDFEEPYADLNHDGTFSYGSDLPCDANHNGRWDGLYSSGGVDHLTEWVHDDIWARAVAVSDGVHTIVIESVTIEPVAGAPTETVGAVLSTTTTPAPPEWRSIVLVLPARSLITAWR